jgi:hypothetical protein
MQGRPALSSLRSSGQYVLWANRVFERPSLYGLLINPYLFGRPRSVSAPLTFESQSVGTTTGVQFDLRIQINRS